jgi:hypothetical protein
MPNSDLLNYIGDARSKRISDIEIRTTLIRAGWTAEDVDTAMKASPPIIPPAITNPAPVEVVGANFVAKDVGTKPKRSMWKISIPILVVLVLVAGGGVVAYKMQLLPFAKKTSDVDLIAQLGNNISKINSSLYSFSFTIESKSRDADAKPMPVSTSTAGVDIMPASLAPLAPMSEAYLAFLPNDVRVVLSASGTTASGGSSTDARFELGADVQFGDFAASIAAAFLKKGDNYYVDISKFPALFIDLSLVKNKWIQFTLDDFGGNYVSADAITNFQNKRDKMIEQGKRTYALAIEDGVLSFAPKTETGADPGTKNLHGFHVAIVREKLPSFYKQLTGEFQQKYGDDALLKFDQKVADYLGSQEFADFFDYWAENGSLDAWIDAATGFPAKLASTYRFVPPDSALKLKNTQFLLTTELSLSNINAPVVIDPPGEFISYDDAAILLSGKPRDIYLYEKQLSNIQALQYALGNYKTYTGTYPDSLEGLAITIAEARKLNPHPATTTLPTAPYLVEYENSSKILGVVPRDVFTKKPYAYAKTAGDYAITYTIHIPSSPPVSSASMYSYDLYANVKVVDGENTATSKTFSTEGDKRGTAYGNKGDARKIADLRQIQNGLELYFNKVGQYPTGIKAWSDLSAKLQDSDLGISNIPGDYCYAVDAQGSSYAMSAPLASNNPVLSSSYVGAVPTGGGMKCSCVPPNYCVSL